MKSYRRGIKIISHRQNSENAPPILQVSQEVLLWSATTNQTGVEQHLSGCSERRTTRDEDLHECNNTNQAHCIRNTAERSENIPRHSNRITRSRTLMLDRPALERILPNTMPSMMPVLKKPTYHRHHSGLTKSRYSDHKSEPSQDSSYGQLHQEPSACCQLQGHHHLPQDSQDELTKEPNHLFRQQEGPVISSFLFRPEAIRSSTAGTAAMCVGCSAGRSGVSSSPCGSTISTAVIPKTAT